MEVREVKLNIKLHPNQQYIQDNAKKFNVISCGKRFGKSRLAIYRAIQKAGNLPNGTVWFIAPTYRQCKQIAWRELLNMLPPHMIRRRIETDLLVELFNGCTIQLIGADNEDALRGIKIHHLVMDESAYIKEYVWPLLRGQLLGNDGSGGADFISSPNQSGRNWFSAFHQDAMKKMQAGDPEWAAFKYTIWDNPTLPVEDIKKLEADTSDDTWKLEYLGIESDYAGTKYSEFKYEQHVQPYEHTQRPLPTYRAIDWGLDHPTVCLWAKVDKANGIVHIYDEFYRSGLIIEEVCNVIKEKTGDVTIDWSVIDPSANRRDQVTGRSVKDEFLRCGVNCVDGDRRGADNIGGRGVDIVKRFLKKNLIRIDPRCKNLIVELRNLQWGDKVGDDATDALRYLLVRMHDLIFNGVLNTRSEEIIIEPKAKQIFNINDPILFPKREMEYASSIRQELAAY